MILLWPSLHVCPRLLPESYYDYITYKCWLRDVLVFSFAQQCVSLQNVTRNSSSHWQRMKAPLALNPCQHVFMFCYRKGVGKPTWGVEHGVIISVGVRVSKGTSNKPQVRRPWSTEVSLGEERSSGDVNNKVQSKGVCYWNPKREKIVPLPKWECRGGGWHQITWLRSVGEWQSPIHVEDRKPGAGCAQWYLFYE